MNVQKYMMVSLLVLAMFLPACDAPAEEAGIDGDVNAAITLEEGSAGGAPDAAPSSDLPPPPRDMFHDESCDFEDWIGGAVDEAALKELGRPYRILKPGDMMTMDHNPTRINVEHDNGKVTRVFCG